MARNDKRMSKQISNKNNNLIDQTIAHLRAKGIAGLDQYEMRLRNNSNNPDKFVDFLFEGRAALMFAANGFDVVLREKPDLQIKLGDELVYAEVTHFYEKEQDILDELTDKATLDDEFLVIGDITKTENKTAWEQISDKAKNKVNKYVDNFPHILVIESSSESLELMATSAVNKYNEEARENPSLRKLNAIMLVNTTLIGYGSSGTRNIEFCETANALIPLSKELRLALYNIDLG